MGSDWLHECKQRSVLSADRLNLKIDCFCGFLRWKKKVQNERALLQGGAKWGLLQSATNHPMSECCPSLAACRYVLLH